jgi:hypothetical protein
MSTYREDVAWAAGLFDGEGFFRYGVRFYSAVRKATGRGYGQQIGAGIQMGEEDVLRRFREVMGFGSIGGPYEYGFNKKGEPNRLMWQWTCSSFEKVQATIAMLWPNLGTRRRARAAEILRAYSEWLANPTPPVAQ